VGQSSQKSVKIDSVLWDELDRWLESPQAEKLGFHSKAQFVTQAVREMLDTYAIREITVSTKVYNKFHRLFQKDKKELSKKGITSFSGYVTHMLEEKMQQDKTFARYPLKIEKIYVEDDKVVLKDNVKKQNC